MPRGDFLYPAQNKVDTPVGHSDRLNNVKSTTRKPQFLLNKESFSENPQPSADTDFSYWETALSSV